MGGILAKPQNHRPQLSSPLGSLQDVSQAFDRPCSRPISLVFPYSLGCVRGKLAMGVKPFIRKSPGFLFSNNTLPLLHSSPCSIPQDSKRLFCCLVFRDGVSLCSLSRDSERSTFRLCLQRAGGKGGVVSVFQTLSFSHYLSSMQVFGLCPPHPCTCTSLELFYCEFCGSLLFQCPAERA